MFNFKEKQKWLTLLLMMFLTLICLSAENQTVIQATDTIRDSRAVINDNFEQLFDRRYEDVSDPTVNNDGADTAGIGQEFNNGNIWLNTSTGKYHICTDNSTGAAVWKKITLSASDVKTLYEANSDTNAFTDALLLKLNNISSSANWVEDSATNGNILIDSAETVVYDDSNVMKLTGDQTASGDKDFSGFIQTGALQATGASITSTEGGVELLYDGVDGMIHSYNRGTSTHMPLNLSGSELDFQIDGVTEAGLNSSGNLFANNNFLVDTINEKTSGNGVDVDGVELKDGGAEFSGNVGIGASPLSAVRLNISKNYQEMLRLTRSDKSVTDTSFGNYLSFYGNDGRQGYIGYGSAGANNMYITNDNGDDWLFYNSVISAPVFIVTADGIVNMPKQSNISILKSSSQSVTADTTDITFDNKQVDSANEFSASTFTPSASGVYKITINFLPSTTGTMQCYANGSLSFGLYAVASRTIHTRKISLTAGTSYTFRSNSTEIIPSALLYIEKLN